MTPTLKQLMEDPVYREFIRATPDPYVIYAGTAIANPSLTVGEPWRVWVDMGDHRWKTGQFASYARAFNTVAKAMRSNARDAVLVSRRVFFPPPGEWESYRVRIKDPKGTRIATRERWVQTYHWDDVTLEWCPRCRRPSRFLELHWTHHALRRQPCLTEDEPYRCVFCGIRRAALPSLNEMIGA